MIGLVATAALLLAPMVQAAPQTAAPPAAVPQAQTSDDPATTVDDIVVNGRPLDQMARDFVGEIAAPNGPRGLARWNGSVCIGVTNLKAEIGQYIVDRVSTVAEDLGLTPGAPGCKPNVIIIASADPDRMASELLDARPRAFRTTSVQMDQGGEALEAFRTSTRPVRWWQVSMPVNSDTGERAIRLAGDLDPSTGAPAYPMVAVSGPSRFRTQIRDDMVRSVIILDVDRLGGVNLVQLADYVSMVALAQIDADAKMEGYDTILNVFDHPEAVSGLTDLDVSYLNGLYKIEQTRTNPGAQARAVAGQLARNLRRDPAAQGAPPPTE